MNHWRTLIAALPIMIAPIVEAGPPLISPVKLTGHDVFHRHRVFASSVMRPGERSQTGLGVTVHQPPLFISIAWPDLTKDDEFEFFGTVYRVLSATPRDASTGGAPQILHLPGGGNAAGRLELQQLSEYKEDAGLFSITPRSSAGEFNTWLKRDASYSGTVSNVSRDNALIGLAIESIETNGNVVLNWIISGEKKPRNATVKVGDVVELGCGAIRLRIEGRHGTQPSGNRWITARIVGGHLLESSNQGASTPALDYCDDKR